MSPEELKTLQIKLTYVGKQEEALPSLAFASPYHTFEAARFIPFRKAGFSYANDDVKVNVCKAGTNELRAAIQRVATLPAVTSGNVAEEKFLSFAMVRVNALATNDQGFEAILNRDQTSALFEQLRLALQHNPACTAVLSTQWSQLGLGIGPLNPDSDGDGLSDRDEKVFGTDPKRPDTDGDGVSDGAEIASGTDPRNSLSR